MSKSIFTIFFLFTFSVCFFGQETSTKQTEYKPNLPRNHSKDSSKNKTKDVKTPLKIIFTPKPRYPRSDTGTICIQGTITMRVEFLKSGKIGKVIPVNKLPYGITDMAIEAAQQIIFEPATINGDKIDVNKRVIFSFSIY